MSYKFFQNKECEFFPCHGIDNQNCLFCYCPLYYQGTECGGDYIILDSGIKDCSHCIKNHIDYDWVVDKLRKANEG